MKTKNVVVLGKTARRSERKTARGKTFCKGIF